MRNLHIEEKMINLVKKMYKNIKVKIRNGKPQNIDLEEDI